MREIKFRAWDKVEKKMLSNADPFALHVSGSNEPLLAKTHSNEDCIFEQYTGLKDKNGHKIYEGDIVREEFEYGGDKTKTIWQVRWCDDECAFELHYVSGFEVDDCSLVADDEEDYEVIGNIHQNPELLEAKNVGN